MNSIALLLVLSFPASSEDDAIAWLKQNAAPIRTIEASDTDDFADLSPIGLAIGKSRIVELGEIAHGDGSTFEARTRLIRYLHEKLGFDVLAFEGGTFDCRRMSEEMSSATPLQTVAGLGLFPLWAKSAQCQGTFEYVRECAKTKRPLELAGFDIQPSGSASKTYPDWVEETLSEGALDENTMDSFRALNAGLFRPPAAGESIPDADVTRISTAIEAAIATARKGAKIDVRRLDFAERTLANWRQQFTLRRLFGENDMQEASNMRDEAMGANLVWLANEHYKDRKIIVWAASRHLGHDLKKCGPPQMPRIYEDYTTMGDVTHRELSDAVYTLFFTAHHGKDSIAGQTPADFGDAPAGSFEELCHRTDAKYLFVDLRSRRDSKAFPIAKMSARPFGYMSCVGPWAEIGDGFFFIDEMQPSVLAESR